MSGDTISAAVWKTVAPISSSCIPASAVSASPAGSIAEPEVVGLSQTESRALEQPIFSSTPLPPPTQHGPKGISFDFNDGCRVVVPQGECPWQVRLSDLDTGNTLFETTIAAGHINSVKRYFVRFRIEIWQQGESVFAHDYSAADRDVLIRFPVDTLGDPLGWFPYAVKFKESHACRLTCVMDARVSALLRDAYPDIIFLTEQEIEADRYYATYTIAVFFLKGGMYEHRDQVPCDFRFVGLHRAAGYILGVDPSESRPRIALNEDTRPINEPYVCIAVQSTLQAKYWNNPHGWREIVGFIRDAGYRVLCIDLKQTHGKGMVWTSSPDGADDMTGDRPLTERARYLKHAAFFVGLSSGLSWLAWAMGTPVVMISGFTHPLTEFKTPYRIINYHACNSCWNDPNAHFDRHDYLTCPRHKDTPRQFECTRLITADQVKATIKRIPGFGMHG
jgi:autotransporter strand-loop-strand O-heptosyltransferase